MDKYISIPYKDNGRGVEGLDCYGLVWKILKEVFNKEIPKLDGVYTGDSVNALKKHRALVPAEQVEAPVDGDIVLIYVKGRPAHVGIYLGGKVLHTTSLRGCVYEPVEKYRRREYYRA